MPNSHASTTAELLLQLLELSSLGATSVDQAVKRARRDHPRLNLARRIGGGLATLESEGLVESIREDGRVLYRVTPSGLAALERRGRFPGGAAVLFTDIVGSTELIAEFGEDGAHERRSRHFSLLRRAIAAHDGREVKSLGDGVMVIFADPAAAARCATDMQRAVAGDRDRLGLRVGLHAGDLLREGNDYFGTTVIVARRLCENARSGETVVSGELRELVGEDGEFAFESLGRMALKGLSDPVDAFSLQWSPGSEADGPGARGRLIRRRAPMTVVG